jgi:hypothetical protein
LNILVSFSDRFRIKALAMLAGPVIVPKRMISPVSWTTEDPPDAGLTLWSLKKPELIIAPVSIDSFGADSVC